MVQPALWKIMEKMSPEEHLKGSQSGVGTCTRSRAKMNIMYIQILVRFYVNIR